MATITVQYKLNDVYRNQILVETGERLPEDQTLEIDLTTLGKAQRQSIVDSVGLSTKVDVSNFNESPNVWNSAKIHRYATPLTVGEAITAMQHKATQLAEETAIKEADRRRSAEESARRTALAKEHGDLRTRIDKELTGKTLDEIRAYKSEVDVEYRRLIEIEGQIAVEFRNRIYTIFDEAEREAKKAQREADKLSWCEAHGSEHLRSAVAAGYDCQRLYVTERAGVEYPGYTVDFNERSDWKDRSCPSKAALAEALTVDGLVVWLTSGTDAREELDYGYDFEPCEAVVIQKYLDRYRLIKTM